MVNWNVSYICGSAESTAAQFRFPGPIQSRSSMIRYSLNLTACAFFFATLLAIGCSGQPARVKPPKLNASQAGKLAMQQYDSNGDGIVAGKELDEAITLKAALANLDENGDGGVSAEEVAKRVETWQESRASVMSFTCRVLRNGRPATNVKVLFEPETFLGDNLKPSSGVTNFAGETMPEVAAEDLPNDDYPAGTQMGLYKVRITNSDGSSSGIAAKYNKQTILAQEVAYDDPAISNNRVIFNID